MSLKYSNDTDRENSAEDIIDRVVELHTTVEFEELNHTQQVICLIYDLRYGHDSSGLTGYFYNHLPDKEGVISRTINSLRFAGAIQSASILESAAALFEEYRDPDIETTWATVLKLYDPECVLDKFDKELTVSLDKEYHCIINFALDHEGSLVGKKAV